MIKIFIFNIFLFQNFYFYPILNTILTLSIPFKDNEGHLKARVENTYVRWLEASGSDLITVHPWSDFNEIDNLLNKVNGVLFQGNTDKTETNSIYYNAIKYIFKKVIDINNKGIKLPLIIIGDDITLITTIINNDNNNIVYNLNKHMNYPNNLKLFKNIEKTIIFKEFENEDLYCLYESNILPNNLNKVITVNNFFQNINLNSFFNIVATSKTGNNIDYISIAEGKKYPIILLSFHPELISYEQNNNHFYIPDSFEAIYISKFICNSFVFFAEGNNRKFQIEEKLKYKGYIEPFGEFPVLYNGRYNFIYNKN